MSRSRFGSRLFQAFAALARDGHATQRRCRVSHRPRVEILEKRALLANITASAVINSVPNGPNFNHTITLSNSSSSDAGIGTFWYAWVPGEDFLATSPISVINPTGWTDSITHTSSLYGTNDGYAIQYVASSSTYYVQPGSSLNFGFESADTPAEVNGNSVYYPGTPVGTSVVYPQGPSSDFGHGFVVAPALQSIAVTPPNPSVSAGGTEQFTATGTFDGGSMHDITSQVVWTSSNTAAVTISNAPGSPGLATAVAPGSSMISAALNGVTGSTSITVNTPSLVSIAVTPPGPQIIVGTDQQFTATGTLSDNSTENLTSQVTWSSSDTAVATIDPTGLATSLAVGTSTISAVLDGITGSTALTITPQLDSITVTPANPSVPKGETEQFTATGKFADGSTENLTDLVTWSSSAPAVATVSNAPGSRGQSTGVAQGTSTISAAFDGITGSRVLTVGQAVLVSIALDPASPSIRLGTTEQFAAIGTLSDSSTENLTSQVTWSSNSTGVASLSAAGLATGLAPGASTISATFDGITGTTVLNVTPPQPVTVTVVQPVFNKKHRVIEILVTFSGSVNASEAGNVETYRLVTPGTRGSFTARNARKIKLRSAVYDSGSDRVTLTLKKALALTTPVQLTVAGTPPSGLQDPFGQFIDGKRDGQPGSNAVAVLRRTGVVLSAIALLSSSPH
jgi:hypothetical protein